MNDWSLIEFPDTKEAYSVPSRVRDYINCLLAERERLVQALAAAKQSNDQEGSNGH